MNITAGLLTLDRSFSEEIKENSKNITFNNYSNIDSIKHGENLIILIDYKFFESEDVIQFYLSKIRKKIQKTPVILIISLCFIDKVNSSWFFDDFILYPLRENELEKRILNLVCGKESDEDTISIGHLNINLKEYLVYLNNERLDLTYKEFEILRLLIQNRGIVYSRKDILNKIWGIEYIGGTRTVDVHVRRLRSKLGDEFNTIIETVRNVGYKCK